jgi:hypothetical protein
MEPLPIYLTDMRHYRQMLEQDPEQIFSIFASPDNTIFRDLKKYTSDSKHQQVTELWVLLKIKIALIMIEMEAENHPIALQSLHEVCRHHLPNLKLDDPTFREKALFLDSVGQAPMLHHEVNDLVAKNHFHKALELEITFAKANDLNVVLHEKRQLARFMIDYLHSNYQGYYRDFKKIVKTLKQAHYTPETKKQLLHRLRSLTTILPSIFPRGKSIVAANDQDITAIDD